MANNLDITVINDDEIQVTTKQYDPATGKEIEPKVDAYLRSTVEGNLKTAQEDVKHWEDILAKFPKQK